MPTIRPSTRTPGSLKLIYQTNGLLHKMSVNLLANQTLFDIGNRRTDALALALKVADVLPGGGESSITGWALYTRPQAGQPAQQVYSEGFTAPIAGTHGQQPGLPDWKSFTITLTGAGQPSSAGYSFGQCRLVMFAGNSIPLAAGQRATSNGEIRALATFLRTSVTMWADFYGQKATTREEAPIQFNAAVQRRYGC